MKNKKWYILLIVLILIVTNAGTFVVANGISIALGDKVIVQTKDSNTAKYISKLLYLKDQIEDNYYKDIDENTILDGAINGMFEAVGDPYTAYYNEGQFKSYIEQIQGTYVGIGVVVGMDEDNTVTVVSPIDDSPGQKAGLISGDKILKVDGKELKGLQLEEVVALIKGEEGTGVVLTILREGEEKPVEKEIVRQEIVMKSVKSQVLDGDIGYLAITQFESYTSDEFHQHLNSLLDKKIKGLIIDVRDNPGGMMDVVAEITDRIMGESVIVYTQDKSGKKEYLKSDGKNKIDLPIVVLINKGSASASEILAGALQDTKTATIVGETSFGKGIVQRMSDIGDGTGYKITVSEYFTPNGRNIHGTGIEPDVKVELIRNSSTDSTSTNDSQLDKAIEIMRDKID